MKRYDDPASWDHDLVRSLAALDGGHLAYFEGLRHADFASEGVLEFQASGVSFSDGWQQGVRVPDATRAHEVIRSVRRFFDHHLKGDPGARAELCEGDETDLIRGAARIGASGLCGVGNGTTDGAARP